MKRMMILVPVLALLMLAAAIAPVMAKAEKVPVAGLSYITGGVPPERIWDTEGGISQMRGAVAYGANYYWIDSALPDPPWTQDKLSTATYKFLATSELSGMENEKTGKSVSHWKVVMSYPFYWPPSGPILGTFEGVMHVESAEGLTTMHCVYQGSGIFEGQTLIVSGTKLSGQPGVIEGFLLTR